MGEPTLFSHEYSFISVSRVQIRVLKDWVKAWLCTLTELQAFVKAVFHHWADLEPILRQGQGSCEGWWRPSSSAPRPHPAPATSSRSPPRTPMPSCSPLWTRVWAWPRGRVRGRVTCGPRRRVPPGMWSISRTSRTMRWRSTSPCMCTSLCKL